MARNVSKEGLEQKIEKIEKAISESNRSYEDILKFIQGKMVENQDDE